MINNKLSLTSKICLAAVFIVLATICQKVVAINYIAVIPFLRISFGGPAVIIFSSILLGPWFGLLVGLGSDVLGYFIFDPKNNAFFPQITAIYALLGFASFFIFLFVKKLIGEKVIKVVAPSFIVLALIAIVLTIWLAPSLKLYGSTYVLEIWQKISITAGLVVLTAILMIFILLYARKNKDINVYQVSFSLLLIEILIMVAFGTLMKGLAFGFATYPVILLCQIIVLFFNIPLNTILISLLSKIVKRKNIYCPVV
ncbi:MAG: hypothetical protein K6C32_04340 [Bacilli bacterium]|nr:hypothetical protein [Bacilli bacterium]